MTDDRGRYKDPELERFFRENKDMVESLIKEEREMIKRLLEEERANFDEVINKHKVKGEDVAKKTMDMFTDPEVQKHFMSMGMEFIMGMTALMKASPLPDSFKDMVDRTEGAGKEAAKDVRKNSEVPKDVQKVDIKSTKGRKKTEDA